MTGSASPLLDVMLKYDEGEITENGRHVPYDDATGKPLKKGDTIQGNITIGWGRNLSGKGLSGFEAEQVFQRDVMEAIRDIGRLFPRVDISPARFDALVNMRFNLGPGGFRGFEKMIAAIQTEDWGRAADECLDSRAARQLPGRYAAIAKALREG